MDFMIFNLVFRLLSRLPGGIWTAVAIMVVFYFWRRGSIRMPSFGGRRNYDPSRDRRAPATITGLTVAYGEGFYFQGGERFEGRILMSRDKLYLVDKGKEIGMSFVPVGKIMKLTRSGSRIELEVVLSLTEDYKASYSGDPAKIKELADDIIEQRGLTKGWFSSAYTDPDHE